MGRLPASSAAAETGPSRRIRLGLLGLAGAGLVAGLVGALVLIGVSMPSQVTGLAARHGLLMTLGFLGTLIALERAVALGRPWGYVAPLASGVGGVALVAGAPTTNAAIPFAFGAAVLIAIYAAIQRRERSVHGLVETAGAGAWLVAALLLVLGFATSDVVGWLVAFLVLTVMGERLELSALMRRSPFARVGFIAVLEVFAVGVTLVLVMPDLGFRVAGVGLVGVAAWAARYDLARRTIRSAGVTRFIAICLLLGYAWLAVAGLAWVMSGSATAGGPGYDAVLHATFLGFAISMVFGHAPVILPGVVRMPLPYSPVFYGHLGLLHAGLLLRVVVGDVLGVTDAWRLGGALNVLAVLVFLAVSVGAVARGAWGRRPQRATRGS